MKGNNLVIIEKLTNLDNFKLSNVSKFWIMKILNILIDFSENQVNFFNF
jgi:hypothetical protein